MGVWGGVVIDSSEMPRMTSALCLRVTLLAYAAPEGVGDFIGRGTVASKQLAKKASSKY